MEIVRAFFETWNAGDMDAFRELYDPDVIVRTVKDWPEPGPYVGREAVMRFHEQLRDTWDADTGVPIGDFIDAGDRVAVRYIWRGAGHGPDMNMELTLVFTMRKGRIFYLEFFWDHAEALEAVGLSEQEPSYDNVAIVRRARDAFNRRDFHALAEMSHEDLEFESVLAAVDGESTYRGRETWPNYFARMDEAWENWQVEDFRPIDAGDDRVVAVYSLTGTGKGSGVRVQQTAGMVYWLRGGKIWRLKSYMDHAEALEAVGLSDG